MKKRINSFFKLSCCKIAGTARNLINSFSPNSSDDLFLLFCINPSSMIKGKVNSIDKQFMQMVKVLSQISSFLRNGNHVRKYYKRGQLVRFRKSRDTVPFMTSCPLVSPSSPAVSLTTAESSSQRSVKQRSQSHRGQYNRVHRVKEVSSNRGHRVIEVSIVQ